MEQKKILNYKFIPKQAHKIEIVCKSCKTKSLVAKKKRKRLYCDDCLVLVKRAKKGKEKHLNHGWKRHVKMIEDYLRTSSKSVYNCRYFNEPDAKFAKNSEYGDAKVKVFT